MKVELSRSRPLKGEVRPPADKSISHRAVMLSSIARGKSVVRNFLRSADTISTVNAFRALGVEITEGEGSLKIEGAGLRGLRESSSIIDCGNSGTTMRLIAGVLSGCPFFSVLTGDDSLRSRPMGRVIAPLGRMGASIMARLQDRYPPLAIRGGALRAIGYDMPVASAQVKSALLLAGLYAEGVTEVREAAKSRDHTERMLPAYGADLSVEGLKIRVKGGAELSGRDFVVPNDFSSAAFFIAASAIVEGSEIAVRSVGLNPTRTGLLDALRKMGARVETASEGETSGEPVGDIVCRHSPLRAIEVGEGDVPSMIDEFPVLCVLASQAEGTTRITGAGELRVKESDRIGAMAEGLRRMGAEVSEHEDGLSIKGKAPLRGCPIESRGDHRVAMAFSIAALVAEGKTVIDGAEAVEVSFPGFFETLGGISR